MKDQSGSLCGVVCLVQVMVSFLDHSIYGLHITGQISFVLFIDQINKVNQFYTFVRDKSVPTRISMVTAFNEHEHVCTSANRTIVILL